MIKTIISKLKAKSDKRFIKNCGKYVEKINLLESEFEKLSDSELKQKSEDLRKEVQKTGELDKNLVNAFALVRESAKRTLGMRHFDVQLIGGIAMHNGNIAEMKTGEGKTFVSTLPAYLNALSGKGVHIISVNDYLTKRDFEWMRPVFETLGLSVGCVVDEMSTEIKLEQYSCDIVYVNNTALGFDYLRDNIRPFKSPSLFNNRGFNYAIIDEADSILIDESRTPLIISSPSLQDSRIYNVIDKIVRTLSKDDYIINEEEKNAYLTDSGVDIVEKALKNYGLIKSQLYDIENYFLINIVQQSIKAHTIFKKNKEYLVKDKQVILIDDSTGRILDGRRYSDGLHQAIEAKENVAIQEESQTIASITYQNLFRMYKKLSGMTGTAKTEEKEFENIYHTKVIQIPTNVPVVRKDLQDLVYMTLDEKNEAIVAKVKEIAETGQPILIGTASVEYSESLSKLFLKNKIKHNVLNAKYHAKEAKIIASAGRKGVITIATNMAGRGTDIKLGGDIDYILQDYLENHKNIKEDEISAKKSEFLEQIAIEKKEILELGGLYIIGAERYESRRVDNQLRGRGGRQGDPGITQFMLSLDDDLLRIFGGEKIKNIVGRLGFKKKEPMQHSMLTRVIEYSQKRIESMNYDTRKHIIRYDDILNQQRLHIYGKREDIMTNSANLYDIINEMISEILEDFTTNEGMVNVNEDVIASINNIFNTKITNADFEGNFEKLLNILSISVKEKIEKHISKHDEKTIYDIVGNVILQTLDEVWKNHLSGMTSLRQSIHLRSYGQKDPLSEYQIESFHSYERCIQGFNRLSINRLMGFEIE